MSVKHNDMFCIDDEKHSYDSSIKVINLNAPYLHSTLHYLAMCEKDKEII